MHEYSVMLDAACRYYNQFKSTMEHNIFSVQNMSASKPPAHSVFDAAGLAIGTGVGYELSQAANRADMLYLSAGTVSGKWAGNRVVQYISAGMNEKLLYFFKPFLENISLFAHKVFINKLEKIKVAEHDIHGGVGASGSDTENVEFLDHIHDVAENKEIKLLKKFALLFTRGCSNLREKYYTPEERAAADAKNVIAKIKSGKINTELDKEIKLESPGPSNFRKISELDSDFLISLIHRFQTKHEESILRPPEKEEEKEELAQQLQHDGTLIMAISNKYVEKIAEELGEPLVGCAECPYMFF